MDVRSRVEDLRKTVEFAVAVVFYTPSKKLDCYLELDAEKLN